MSCHGCTGHLPYLPVFCRNTGCKRTLLQSSLRETILKSSHLHVTGSPRTPLSQCPLKVSWEPQAIPCWVPPPLPKHSKEQEFPADFQKTEHYSCYFYLLALGMG